MKARLGVSLSLAAIAMASSFACLSPDERDLDDAAGAAGTAGATAGTAGTAASAGKGGATSGGSAGTTAAGAAGSAGLASGGTGVVSGTGGVAGSNTAGTGASNAGTGGSDPMTGGSNNGGNGASMNGGAGGSNDGGSISGGNGGSDAGTSGSNGAGAGGSNGCAPNYDCMLEPPPSTGDPRQDCVDRINQFRAECACLPPLERWTDGEDCANQMAEYDSTRSAHAGFSDGICEGGSAQNECPGWGSTEQVIDGCLQAMWSEGPPPQDPCDGDCFQEHGHFINMTNERYTAVACGFYETAEGEIWAVQNFTR